MHFSRLIVAAGIALAAAPAARAGTTGSVSVNATDVIYAAGLTKTPGGSGTIPQAIIPVTSDEHLVLIRRVRGTLSKGCTSSEGCITLNKGYNLNDADGTGGQLGSSSNTGTKHVSGIKAPGEGYLVGVFLRAGGPSGELQPVLDFTVAPGTAFTTLRPKIDQTFFIGDGRTQDGLGQRQRFIIPNRAASLVLGFSDTCQSGNGPPGCYYDNKGSLRVEYQTK